MPQTERVCWKSCVD